MKCWKLVCTLVLALALLMAMPALAEEAGEPETTMDPVCESGTGPDYAHAIDENGWTVTKPATCTEAGTRQGLCTLCGKVYIEAIPATASTPGMRAW